MNYKLLFSIGFFVVGGCTADLDSFSNAENSSDSSGNGGKYNSGVTVFDTLKSYRSCEDAEKISLRPEENNQVALGRFIPNHYPWKVNSFNYELTSNPNDFGGICALLPHQVVYYVSTSLVPSEQAVFEVLENSSPVEGLNQVKFNNLTLNDSSSEQDILYVGLVMKSNMNGHKRLCISSCGDFTLPNGNFWSDNIMQPWGWRKLSESPSIDLGLKEDYNFTVDGSYFRKDK